MYQTGEAAEHFHTAALKSARDWYNTLTLKDQMEVKARFRNFHSLKTGTDIQREAMRELRDFLPDNITINQLKEAMRW